MSPAMVTNQHLACELNDIADRHPQMVVIISRHGVSDPYPPGTDLDARCCRGEVAVSATPATADDWTAALVKRALAGEIV